MLKAKQDLSTTGEVYGNFIIWILSSRYNDEAVSIINIVLAIASKSQYLDSDTEYFYDKLFVKLKKGDDREGISFAFGEKSEFVKQISLNRVVVNDNKEMDRRGYKARIRVKESDKKDIINEPYQDSAKARDLFARAETKLTKVRTMNDYLEYIEWIKNHILLSSDRDK